MADAIVAGIAKAQGLLIVTRNTKHFLPLGGALLSPDEAAQQASSDACFFAARRLKEPGRVLQSRQP
jgi:hypothetical protein